jgi:hypothetical protein
MTSLTTSSLPAALLLIPCQVTMGSEDDCEFVLEINEYYILDTLIYLQKATHYEIYFNSTLNLKNIHIIQPLSQKHL